MEINWTNLSGWVEKKNAGKRVCAFEFHRACSGVLVPTPLSSSSSYVVRLVSSYPNSLGEMLWLIAALSRVKHADPISMKQQLQI